MPTIGQILQSASPPKKVVSRRWRWARRIGSTVLLLSAIYGYRLWDRHRARELLDQRLAAIRARGEPTSLADLSHQPIPDEQNAAKLLLAAERQIHLESDDQKRLDEILEAHPNTPPKEYLEFAQKLIEQNQAVFSTIAAARRLNQVDWQIKWNHPALDSNLIYLNRLRGLAEMLRYGAWVHHHSGDDAAALRDISHLLYLQRITDDPGTIVTHLVADGICAMACERVRQTALNLDLRPRGVREQVSTLLHEMTDENARKAAIQRTLQGERATSLDNYMYVGEHAYWRRADVDRIAVKMLDDCDAIEKACLAQNYQGTKVLLPKPNPEAANSKIGQLREIMLPSLLKFPTTEFRALTELRVAAIALALRLYMADHDGRLPAKLEELTTKYLQAIPIDPFAADGRPLAWRAEPRIVVWSVSENGQDDGIAARIGETDQVPYAWNAPDALFELPKRDNNPKLK